MAISEDSANIIDPMTVSPRPIGIRYGLIIGIIGVIIAAVGYITGIIDLTGKNMGFAGYAFSSLSILFTVFFLYKAINEYKEEELGGYLSLRSAVGVGVWAGLINGLISAVWMFLYTSVLDPDFYKNVKKYAAESYAAQGMSDEQIESTLEVVGGFLSPTFYISSTIIAGIVIAAIISLIIGFILGRPYPTDKM